MRMTAPLTAREQHNHHIPCLQILKMPFAALENAVRGLPELGEWQAQVLLPRNREISLHRDCQQQYLKPLDPIFPPFSAPWYFSMCLLVSLLCVSCRSFRLSLLVFFSWGWGGCLCVCVSVFVYMYVHTCVCTILSPCHQPLFNVDVVRVGADGPMNANHDCVNER